MPTRSIVCLLEGMERETSALETAVAIALHERAHLKILHASRVTMPPVHAAPGGIFVDTAWIEALSRQRDEATAAARKATAEACARHSLTLDGPAGEWPRVTFVEVEERASELLRELALCDLIVFGADPGEDVLSRPAVEVAVFSSRRPLLMVQPHPGGAPAKVPQGRCALAWNGSPESILALINARPLMERASEIILFSTEGADRAGPTSDQAAAIDYLAAHGLDVTLETVAADGTPAAEALLERVRAKGCDYLVMGAYGHSVFREMVLGGFSQHMLRHCELSLVLSH